MARLLLLRDAVVKAVRYAAIVLVALSAVAIAAPPAFAESINLLRPATRGLPPSILIDAARRPLESDDQATASLDDDCVALNDRERNSSSRFGSVRWNFGQLTWDWSQADEPSLIYILCVDPKQGSSPLGGGGLAFMAGLSWSRAQPAARPGEVPPPNVIVAGSERPLIAGAPNTNPNSYGGDVPAANSGGMPAVTLNEAFPFSTSGAIGSTSEISVGPGFDSGDRFGGGGNAGAPMAPFDPPITLDPEEMAPVPEPGTWLLMGTGLAAAWRAARKRR